MYLQLLDARQEQPHISKLREYEMLQYVLILSVFLGTTPAQTIASKNYPKLSESKARHQITVGNSFSRLSYAVEDETGKSVYWLHCFSGYDDVLDKLSDETGINFVGPFTCRLSESTEFYSEATLLTENTEFSYWHSRGAFSLNSIEKGCGDGTDYGSKRSFKLRGMKLTLEIENIKRTAESIKFELITTITNDVTANTESAQSVEGKPSYWINGRCS